VATAGGGSVVLHPLVTVALGVVFGVVVRLSRRASAGSVAITVLLPIGVALAGRPAWEVVAAAALAALVLVRHRGNVQRLLAGTEQTYRG
jgi:glycerol-3-phosphate acyltransferase PlsY